ncbi:MAG: hypothetical protein QRY74_06040 [Chlamydia sp.]
MMRSLFSSEFEAMPTRIRQISKRARGFSSLFSKISSIKASQYSLEKTAGLRSISIF